jgi:hypothetical protein
MLDIKQESAIAKNYKNVPTTNKPYRKPRKRITSTKAE